MYFNKETIDKNVDVKGKREDSKRRVIEKASVVSEKTYIIMNRMVVEVWTLKVILVKSQLEIKNMLLETKRR